MSNDSVCTSCARQEVVRHVMTVVPFSYVVFVVVKAEVLCHDVRTSHVHVCRLLLETP